MEAGCRHVLIAAALAFAALVPALALADPRIVELRHSDTVLRETYAKGKRMNLPRLLLLDGQGRPLLIEVGLSDGVGRRLAKALDADKPLETPITMELVLSEVVDTNGKPVAPADLPKADGYVVDYWADWCSPCRMLAREIQSQLGRWKDKNVVWLKIESDPAKLPENIGKH